MSDEQVPPHPSAPDDLPPLTVADMPPQLRAALKQMSRRGPVVNMTTGETVAEAGELVGEEPGEGLVGCLECARAVALGQWGGVARHEGMDGAPVCLLCGEGEATLTAVDWFLTTAKLADAMTAAGTRATWREDSVRGARTLGL